VNKGSRVNLPDRPYAELRLDDSSDPVSRLSTCARVFAGWNLTVAVLGYLQDITFAGQPAVESYKSYARRLRDAPGVLPYPGDGLDLERSPNGAAAVLASRIRSLAQAGRLGYFDLTVNCDAAGPLWDAANSAGREFGNQVLRRPVKIRCGPRDYHSTEQSETAGSPDLLSLRVLVTDPEPVVAGEYGARFLQAQALGTVLAMREAGRQVLLASVCRADGDAALAVLLRDTASQLGRPIRRSARTSGHERRRLTAGE
jgi:hypothetical protein